MAPSARKSRHTGERVGASSNSTSTALPEYQPLEDRLTPTSVRALNALSQAHSTQKTRSHVTTANTSLTELAGEVNDRLYRRQDLLRRKRAKQARDGTLSQVSQDENGQDAEEAEAVTQMNARVGQMTQDMEARTRDLIDVQVRLDGFNDVLKGVGDIANSQLLRSGNASTSRRQGRRGGNGEEDDDMQDGDVEASNSQAPSFSSAHDQFKRDVETRKIRYAQESMRQRYASNNSYIGFKRTVHDALHPEDDAPPVSHADTWFDEEHARPSQAQADDADVDSDDDVAIAREKTSLKCPLTLRPFEDPVTSTKCPHSFEKSAIMDMIARSDTRVHHAGVTVRGGEPAVTCPVCGDKLLTKADFISDTVLLRRVKRLQELESGREEDRRESSQASRPADAKGVPDWRSTQHDSAKDERSDDDNSGFAQVDDE